MRNTNYSYDTSLPAYHSNANEKQRQRDYILSLVTEDGITGKELEYNLKKVYGMTIPQSTIFGRIKELKDDRKVMYASDKKFYSGKLRKKIVPYKEFTQAQINFADNGNGLTQF